MNTLGYDQGYDLEFVREMIIQNEYNAEHVVNMLLGGGGDLGVTFSSSSCDKKKKLSRQEKKDLKKREKSQKVEAIKSRATENRYDHADIDPEAIKKFGSIRI